MSGSSGGSKQGSNGASASVNRPIKTSQEMELENMLVKGEEVVLRAEVHWAIYWKAVLILVVAFLMFFVIKQFAIILGVVGAFMLCVSILTQHYLLLVVTNKRVLARYGLLQMDVVDVRLSKIESIDLERMLLGHLLGYASVVVAGTGQRVIRIPFIANSEIFRRYYNEMALADEGSEEAEEEIEKIKEKVDETAPKKSSKPQKAKKPKKV